MISIEGYIVIAVIIFLIVSLYINKIGPGFTFAIGIAILGIFRILTPEQILAGFANQQIAVIIMLLLLGSIIRKTGVLDEIFLRTFAKIKSYRQFKLKMMLMVAGFSAFLNNTPLVAIMMPYVNTWSKKNNIAPSKLMIPLSYAAILGGCATMIGTASNLLVAGMVADQNIPGVEQLEIFDFSFVGFLMVIFGITYLVLFGNKLLPVREDVIQNLEIKNREYISEVRITNGNEYHGKTVEEAGLRKLKGLFLVEILRNKHSIKPVSPKTRLHENDILLFAGQTENITEMVDAHSGLQLAQIGMYAKKAHTAIQEVVISYNSTLISKTAKEVNFRSKFDAAIIAIHRNGERVSGKLGEVEMVAGDVLLLLTGEDFDSLSNEAPDFYIINRIREFVKQPVFKKLILLGGILAAIVFSATGLVKLFTALLLLLILILALQMVSPKDIGKSLDYNLLIILGLSLALGTAMIESGVAGTFATYTLNTLKPFGIVGLLLGLFLLTNILTSILANAAAVAIVFPIAFSIALDQGLNPKPFVLTVALAGAASFMTPIGYQTNLMVYGPGGYNFKDFMRIGFPLTVIYMIVTVLGLIFQFDIKLY